ncbi:MAG TPA: type II secretion system protein [Thermoanaerobaculia bacterium]|nr:type II secretion system protein [Thermoanaerobaculia bacterium]
MIQDLHNGLAGRRRLGHLWQGGYTFAELVMVCAVLSTLAAVTLPVAKFSVKRVKEAELRSALRTMRNAIDEYKRYSDAALLPQQLGADGYPQELEELIEPIDVVGQVDKQIRFLRRIPVDPMTGEAEWGMRSTSDPPDSTSHSGDNLFDVYSLSSGVGLDGVPYAEW